MDHIHSIRARMTDMLPSMVVDQGVDTIEEDGGGWTFVLY